MFDLVCRGAVRAVGGLVLAAVAGAGGCDREAATAGKVVVMAAPPGDVAPWVKDQLAAAGDRQVIVYVGASWCEPCQHFHEAVASGNLDGWFPRLTLLEFDLDRDEDRLTTAGYTSSLIPLFVRPGTDGRASGRAIQGSIHGAGAVAELTPRLLTLLYAGPR